MSPEEIRHPQGPCPIHASRVRVRMPRKTRRATCRGGVDAGRGGILSAQRPDHVGWRWSARWGHSRCLRYLARPTISTGQSGRPPIPIGWKDTLIHLR